MPLYKANKLFSEKFHFLRVRSSPSTSDDNVLYKVKVVDFEVAEWKVDEHGSDRQWHKIEAVHRTNGSLVGGPGWVLKECNGICTLLPKTVRNAACTHSGAQEDPPTVPEASAPAMASRTPANVIIWGESGDGKSTLVNKLMGRDVAQVGRAPGGVTKKVASYDLPLLGTNPKVAIRVWDMPGAGDRDVPAYRTLQELSAALKDKPIAGILLLSSRPERMPLGAQIVAELMNQSFPNGNKWDCVVLVGTKSDRYDPGDAENFTGPVLREFNRSVGGKISKAVTINQTNVQPVRDVLVQIARASGLGSFEVPDAARVGRFLGAIAGAQEELDKERRRQEAEAARRREQNAEAERRLQRQRAEEQRRDEQRNRERQRREEAARQRRLDQQRALERQRRENRRREEALQQRLRHARRPRSPPGIQICSIS